MIKRHRTPPIIVSFWLVWLAIVPPAKGAARDVLGQIVRSKGTSLGSTPVPNEGTLVDGDVLTTAKGGAALIKFSLGIEASISEGTSVSFYRTTGQVLARLSAGEIFPETVGKDALVVETPKYRIAPEGKSESIYQVKFVPGRLTLVAVEQGSVSITETATGKHYVVRAKQQAFVDSSAATTGEAAGPEGGKMAAGRAAGQAPPNPAEEKTHSNTGYIILGGGAAAAAAAGLAASGGGGGGGGPASPSRP